MKQTTWTPPRGIFMTFQKTYRIVALFLGTFSAFTAYSAKLSDFSADVQAGVLSAPQNSTASSIKSQEYKTSWDEFGTNILSDGAQPAAEIQKDLIEDITHDLQMQVAYDQKDAQYLDQRQSSPEEIVALESADGSDVLPENYFEPHPSLDANPDVNPSALDVATTTIDIPDTMDPATTDTTIILPDNLLPPDGEWKPADITVFENIVNEEPKAQPVEALSPSPDIAPPSEVPTEPIPEPSPEPTQTPDIVPLPDTTTN